MRFAVGDRVKLKRDMFGGKVPKGSLGTVRKVFGAVSYLVKFDGVNRLVRVLEQDLAPA